MEYVIIVVMLTLIQYTWFSIEVARARGRFEVQVPATSGSDGFERYFRAHQNTTEQLVIFLPAIFACGYYVNAIFAAVMGLFFLIGRWLYFRGYTDPEKSRSIGFGIGMTANVLMILSTLCMTGVAALGYAG